MNFKEAKVLIRGISSGIGLQNAMLGTDTTLLEVWMRLAVCLFATIF